MTKEDENNWAGKIKRSLTAFLPVSKDRRGRCVGCGQCCKLPVKCIFFRENPEGKGGKCTIYKIRPPACRKYPRTEKEHITKETCGYHFQKKE
jgi:uncharacterized protein